MSTNIPILNITVLDAHSVKLLGIADISYYPNNFSIINPTIEITPPSFPKVTLPITYSNLNIFTSNDVGITCNIGEGTDLPDGIWLLKYTIAPSSSYSVQKSFLRTDIIQKEFGLAVLQTKIKQCNEDIEMQDMRILDQVWYYIQGAIADGNLANNTAAMDKYRKADRMLDNFMKSKA